MAATQNIDKFYGLQATVSYDVQLSSYDEVSDRIRNAAGGISLESGEEFAVYVTSIHLRPTRSSIWGVSGINNRAQYIDVLFSIGKKNRDSQTLQFLNNRLDRSVWLPDSELEVSADPAQISVRLPSTWTDGNQNLELFLVTAVSNRIRARDRFVMVDIRLQPTLSYRQFFINHNGVVQTTMKYELSSDIRLATQL